MDFRGADMQAAEARDRLAASRAENERLRAMVKKLVAAAPFFFYSNELSDALDEARELIK